MTRPSVERTVISERVFPREPRYARLKAEGWWQRRSVAPLPATVDEAISGSASLLRPSHIFVRMNGQFSVRNGPTMSGLTTSWRIAPMTDGSIAC